eukprot:2456305-Alexandrium_andersonii.AAC.1
MLVRCCSCPLRCCCAACSCRARTTQAARSAEMLGKRRMQNNTTAVPERSAGLSPGPPFAQT